MPQSLSRILVHTVFSTKSREPFLTDKAVREEMHAYIAGTCTKLGSPSMVVGGVADHVHILCALSKNVAVAKFVYDVKRSSSKWIKTKGHNFAVFHWQNGYGAFSVSESQVTRVKAYIANQEQHHRKLTFEEEFRRFLKAHPVEYDERYVWD